MPINVPMPYLPAMPMTVTMNKIMIMAITIAIHMTRTYAMPIIITVNKIIT